MNIKKVVSFYLTESELKEAVAEYLRKKEMFDYANHLVDNTSFIEYNHEKKMWAVCPDGELDD